MKKLLAVLSLLALTTVSSAESPKYLAFVDGNTLLSFLEEEKGSAKNYVALGFIQGVSDTLASLDFVCLPKKSNPQQLMDMAKNYLKDNPSTRHNASADTIGFLYMKTFPCNDSPK